jgi:import inner membrane translocase subunit TIM13
MTSAKQLIVQETARANMQELIQTLSDKCFKKCVTNPRNRLDNNEQGCINNCVDRFVESWQIVAKTLSARAQSEEMALRGF